MSGSSCVSSEIHLFQSYLWNYLWNLYLQSFILVDVWMFLCWLAFWEYLPFAHSFKLDVRTYFTILPLTCCLVKWWLIMFICFGHGLILSALASSIAPALSSKAISCWLGGIYFSLNAILCNSDKRSMMRIASLKDCDTRLAIILFSVTSGAHWNL